VTSIGISIVLQASLIATGANSYSEARSTVTETGQPMVVLVGAEWCPACVEMKQNVIPKVKRRGILRKIVFATVNLDKQQKLGRQLTDGGPIPQLIMFRKTEKGWKRRKLIGGQSVGNVENFVSQGMELDTSAKKDAKRDAGRSI